MNDLQAFEAGKQSTYREIHYMLDNLHVFTDDLKDYLQDQIMKPLILKEEQKDIRNIHRTHGSAENSCRDL